MLLNYPGALKPGNYARPAIGNFTSTGADGCKSESSSFIYCFWLSLSIAYSNLFSGLTSSFFSTLAGYTGLTILTAVFTSFFAWIYFGFTGAATGWGLGLDWTTGTGLTTLFTFTGGATTI